MLPIAETIYIQRGTFGTSLQFSLYSGETSKDLPASSYDKIVFRAYSYPDMKLFFSGDVEETLSEVSDNIVTYLFKEQDTLKEGVFSLKLELINKSGDNITRKEVLDCGKLKIEK